jgi:hypothetical protein
MRSRPAGLILLLVLICVGIGAGVQTWLLQRRAAGVDAAAQDVDGRLDRMLAAASEIGATQQAYVAPGQADDASFAGVSTLVDQLSKDIALVIARARSAETRGVLHSATESIAAFVQLDAELREHLRLGEELIAADRIFAEGRRSLEAIVSPLRGARDAERAAAADARATILQQTWITVGAAALAWLAGLMLLLRSNARHAAPVASFVPLPAAAQARPSFDLGAAADVCVAISRIASSAELPALLARVAAVLDASGVIVWMNVGEELFPVTSHGYDPRVVARLGSIPKSADNATAASWRSGEVKIVPGDLISDGAIAAPMFRLDTCIGVLAAEVRHGRENDADVRAVISLISAQLASVLAAWSPESTTPAAPPATTGSGAQLQ